MATDLTPVSILPGVPLAATELGETPPDGAGRIRVAGKGFVRGGRKVRIRGVTYGPFGAGADGQPFPDPGRAAEDFALMGAAGVNAVRTYHVPPEWLLGLADEHGISVLVDVPWPKHVCFLDSRAARDEARRLVRHAADRGRGHASLLAYSVGNEIRPDVVRWHGTRRVERFLAELRDVAKQADPEGLVTYANYPSTEYLDTSVFDFATFNVYLHDREAFRRYLFRLQNLVGDRPLVLGELGMDTLRHGELEQAAFLQGHIEEATVMGLAGAFVFAWTDDWHTGGHPIEDWAFGITRVDRAPKAAFHAVREVFDRPTAELLRKTPRVSVVVCSYNGGRTLTQCLSSLLALDYPDYEVILVDDGSTDATPEIAARFPDVRTIRQANLGLSAARNVGLRAATGQVVAYTDSDCFADPDWLTHLVHQLERSGAAAVGGPNLTPEDGWLAACVAAAPGQPTHVLESDQVAEHIPGCNMAYRREALEAINGFDPQYRKAGDDVDVCWRLQHEGYWISFAPGAFVWHHRRQTPRTFLRQQAGYGEAEALLRFKHPDKFNGRGDGKWRGVMYGDALSGLRLTGAFIYRGTFGTGLFQTLYRPGPAHWAMLPGTLEWHLAAILFALIAPVFPAAWWVVGAMLVLAPAVAGLQAAQARPAPAHDGFRSRCVVALLCYLQPLVRSWARHRTRLLSRRTPDLVAPQASDHALRLRWSGTQTVEYWSERWDERTTLLDRAVAYLNDRGWGKVIDSGWSDWDLQISCCHGASVQVCTVQEDHGSGKRLIRVRYRLRTLGATGWAGVIAAVVAVTAGAPAWASLAAPAAVSAAALLFWRAASRRAARVAAAFDGVAREIGLIPCVPDPRATVEARPQGNLPSAAAPNGV